MRSVAFTAILLFAVLASGASSRAQAPDSESSRHAAGRTASVPTTQIRNPRYQLRRSDSFDLSFAFSPEFNQTVSVQPDGYITLKAVGTIYVQGSTVPELTDRIQHAYAGVLHDPVVTVELKDFDKPYFIASGQLGKPGKYDLRSDFTVSEAVAVAGGFTDASKHSEVVLFRPAENGLMEARLLDVKKMLDSHDLSEDVHLQPGDMIFVPKNRISKIQRYLPTSSLGLYGNPQIY